MANENIMDLNEYVIAFNELLEKVAGIFENFFTKTRRKEISDAEFELKYRELSNDIFNATEEIAKSLKTYNIHETEYIDFRGIQRIIMEVVRNESKWNEENFEIVSEFLGIFKEITELKIKILEKSIKENKRSLNDISPELKEEFESKYEEFKIEHLLLKFRYYKDRRTSIDTKPFFEPFLDEYMRGG